MSVGTASRPGQGRNLALALLAFTITFWAWNVIAPLGVRYAEALSLSVGQKSLLVATPVLVGSLGRIVTGALTDRFGGRLMLPTEVILEVDELNPDAGAGWIVSPAR